MPNTASEARIAERFAVWFSRMAGRPYTVAPCIVWPVRCAASRPAGSSRFFKEVGQRPDFQPCLEHDFIGANARARRIDEPCAKEFPVRYSFGGLRREGGGESEMPPPGISEPELLAICVSPYLDSTPVLACLKEWFGPFRKRIYIVRNRR
jgi:hypothetical protein